MAHRSSLDSLMNKSTLIHSGTLKVTKLILYGSLCVSVILTSLLFGYDLTVFQTFRFRTIVGLVVILYLIACWILIHKCRVRIASWMLITLYAAISFSTLLIWGLNTPAGIFTVSFVIILAGILIGSKAILPVSIGVFVLLFGVQTIHSLKIIIPNLTPLHQSSTFMDVLSYATVLGIFALIIWASGNQFEKSLERAKKAEAALRAQKESLVIELEHGSALLRETQLKQMKQLYKFATLGQSTAATLHELSNHLSVLNMDIDDLKQQHRNSAAIANAQDGINHINQMVRQVRRKLDTFDDTMTFKIGATIKKVLKDLSDKTKFKFVAIRYYANGLGDTRINGDPLALTQIITVLLTNATEACLELTNAKIEISLEKFENNIQVIVTDNGIGIDEIAAESLFTPTLSSKPTGLGVGLYIAHHLAVSQFDGSIRYENHAKQKQNETRFIVSIPLTNEKEVNEKR